MRQVLSPRVWIFVGERKTLKISQTDRLRKQALNLKLKIKNKNIEYNETYFTLFSFACATILNAQKRN
jgi:hypothetical protein